MNSMNFNQEWYGSQAKVLTQAPDCIVVDYGCNGRGIVKNYNLFEGIQLCFLDFNTDETMVSKKFNSDIIQITHCRSGRYECEFLNHTVSYLPEGYFGVAGTEYLPISFSFPLKKYIGVSLVIDKQALSDETRKMMKAISIDLDKIGTTLGIEKKWYVNETPPKLQHLFSELYEVDEAESMGYFKIKAIAFASVYALNPDIFVLDEPSSNLDPDAIQELRRLLLLIKAQGKTIIVSEHRLYFLNGIADRIVLMELGKMKKVWTAKEFQQLSSEQIKALGLRSYTPTKLSLSEETPQRNDVPAIEVNELSIGYEKGEAIVEHLNFSVYCGEIVGIVGKNGCGKTTLARTVCGLQKALQGEIFFSGNKTPYNKRIKKAYLVMQDPDYQLFTDSVYQELKLALSDRKEREERMIDDILDELNLSIYKDRHPMSLSGGQKQRTAIGVAALRDSEVIIFDEPTSGLDYKNMESVAKILRTLSQRGKAILVISHDNELLMKVCTRIIRIEGRSSS